MIFLNGSAIRRRMSAKFLWAHGLAIGLRRQMHRMRLKTKNVEPVFILLVWKRRAYSCDQQVFAPNDREWVAPNTFQIPFALSVGFTGPSESPRIAEAEKSTPHINIPTGCQFLSCSAFLIFQNLSSPTASDSSDFEYIGIAISCRDSRRTWRNIGKQRDIRTNISPYYTLRLAILERIWKYLAGVN